MRTLRVALMSLLTVLVTATAASAVHVTDGADVKVTNDNNNVDGGTPNPGFDAQNRQSNETTVAISPADPSIVATGANDYRMVTVTGDVWYGLYVSADGGATWFNTMVPGFPSDASAAGLASPLLGLDGSGDPVVRFDASGNMYAAGIAFNRDFDQPDRPIDTVSYVARYNYTPGTPGGTSSSTSAANPPNFTYVRTRVVDRGSVGFAVPGVVGFAGDFVDKEWMEIDTNASSASPCAGNIYVAQTNFHASGTSPIRFSRSTNGGLTFSKPKGISTGGTSGTRSNQGADIAVGPDGTVFVAYQTDAGGNDRESGIGIVRSTDCGRSWGQPVRVGSLVQGQAPGVAFRTPTFAVVSVDDTDSETVYVAYQSLVDGDYDILAQRSADGGSTWGAPVTVNDDPGDRHQIFPTMDVSHGALHVAWYDFRNSTTAANEALDVYYACTDCAGSTWPTFSHVERVSDVSHNGNCLLFGGGTAAFHGDYNELDAVWNGTNHIVHVAWADNRDVSPCDLDPAAGPASNNTGNRNQNIYADTLTVAP
ncbi:MAG TPA: sialidase family protein [Actinomycetota bacterium]|nr:sialidase family protein [Actinomycetota bacterium]